MNRRNLLIGIGTAAVGTGGVLGSGALTSVEAERSVDVKTVGDANALIGLEGDGTYVTDPTGTDSTLSINIGNALSSSTDAEGLNDNAVTSINPVVTVTNNSNTDINIDLAGSTGATSPNDSVTIDLSDSDVIVEFEYVGSSLAGTDSGTTSESGDIKATVYTGDQATSYNSGTDGSDSLVIVANENTP